MPHASGGWTAEMVRALPEDGQRYEVIDGELYVSPSPIRPHQRMVTRLISLLVEYLDATGVGEVLPDLDTEADPRTMVRPDLIVPSPTDEADLLLVVEILSPSSRKTDRTVKRALYARMNVHEYWIVDLEERSVDRWRAGATVADTLRSRISWQPQPSVPPLEIDLVELFRKAAGPTA